MNPLQLRETTMDPNTRRLVQLTYQADSDELSTEEDTAQSAVNNTEIDKNPTLELMDMLLAKKRSEDRKNWLQHNGNQADLAV